LIFHRTFEQLSFIEVLSSKFLEDSSIPTQSMTLSISGKIALQHPMYISAIAVLALSCQCSWQGCQAIPVADREVFDIGDNIVGILGGEDWVYSLPPDTVIFLSPCSNIVIYCLEYFVRYIHSIV